MGDCISEFGHAPHPDQERHPGRCVKCRQPIPDEPWRITEKSAGEFYDQVCNIMLEGYELPCSMRRPTLERFFKLGERQYGDQYLMRENAPQGQDEGSDAGNYAMMESHRLVLEDLDPGDEEALRGLLMEAAVLAAKLYEKFGAYQQRLYEARSMVPR